MQRRRRTKEEMRLREWKQTELKALEEQLLLFGEGNTPKIRSLVHDHTFSICSTSFPLSLSLFLDHILVLFIHVVQCFLIAYMQRPCNSGLEILDTALEPGHGSEDPQSSRNIILILLYYRVGAF